MMGCFAYGCPSASFGLTFTFCDGEGGVEPVRSSAHLRTTRGRNRERIYILHYLKYVCVLSRVPKHSISHAHPMRTSSAAMRAKLGTTRARCSRMQRIAIRPEWDAALVYISSTKGKTSPAESGSISNVMGQFSPLARPGDGPLPYPRAPRPDWEAGYRPTMASPFALSSHAVFFPHSRDGVHVTYTHHDLQAREPLISGKSVARQGYGHCDAVCQSENARAPSYPACVRMKAMSRTNATLSSLSTFNLPNGISIIIFESRYCAA